MPHEMVAAPPANRSRYVDGDGVIRRLLALLVGFCTGYAAVPAWRAARDAGSATWRNLTDLESL